MDQRDQADQSTLNIYKVFFKKIVKFGLSVSFTFWQFYHGPEGPGSFLKIIKFGLSVSFAFWHPGPEGPGGQDTFQNYKFFLKIIKFGLSVA